MFEHIIYMTSDSSMLTFSVSMSSHSHDCSTRSARCCSLSTMAPTSVLYRRRSQPPPDPFPVLHRAAVGCDSAPAASSSSRPVRSQVVALPINVTRPIPFRCRHWLALRKLAVGVLYHIRTPNNTRYE